MAMPVVMVGISFFKHIKSLWKCALCRFLKTLQLYLYVLLFHFRWPL